MVSGTLLPLLTLLLLVSFTCSQNPLLGFIFLTENDPLGDQALLVAESAVKDINNSSNLLPAHQLHILREESGCDNPFDLAPHQMAQVLHEELSDKPHTNGCRIGWNVCHHICMYVCMYVCTTGMRDGSHDLCAGNRLRVIPTHA